MLLTSDWGSIRGLTGAQTLLVSQWTGCLSLISDYLTENGIPHVKYQGDMTRTKRDQAVKVFMAKEKARVMLMSLKCGGQSFYSLSFSLTWLT